MSVRPSLEILNYHGVPVWRNVIFIRYAMQVFAALAVASVVGFLAVNLMNNAEQWGVNLSFRLLQTNAGFDVPYSLIPYDSSRSILYAFLAGLSNTIRLVVIGAVLTTIVGIIIGLARLSSNWLISKLATVYVEGLRNIPLIVFAFFLFYGLLTTLPQTKEAWRIPGVGVASNRGIYTTSLDFSSSLVPWLLFVAAGLMAAYMLRRLFFRYEERLGRLARPLNTKYTLLLIVTAMAVLGWVVQPTAPFSINQPVLEGVNFRGGMRFTTEFFAILAALTLYIASYVAEIVRGAVQSVPGGQLEAARALGMSYKQVIWNIVLPQAARIAVPPMIGQYVNLTKGSALAIVVGYSEVFVVSRTAIEKTGLALQIFILLIVTYLIIGVIYSLIGNWYNRKVLIVER